MVIRIYGRYLGVYEDSFDDVHEAIRTAQGGAEAGEDYTLALYEPRTNTLFVPDLNPIGMDSAKRLAKARSYLQLDPGHQFSAVEPYPTFPD